MLHDEVSLNVISLKIINGIINLRDPKTPGQNIPDRCVPTLNRIHEVDNHNSYVQ